jgi:hypothetical protein
MLSLIFTNMHDSCDKIEKQPLESCALKGEPPRAKSRWLDADI